MTTLSTSCQFPDGAEEKGKYIVGKASAGFVCIYSTPSLCSFSPH